MGTWFQEEVAGDRYIFDSELNPVVLGCPQGEPVFVIPGEHAAEAERACVAHNAALDGTRERAAEIRSDFKRLAEKIADGTSPRVKQGEGKPYAIPSVAEYEVLMEAYLQQRHEIARVKHALVPVPVGAPCKVRAVYYFSFFVAGDGLFIRKTNGCALLSGTVPAGGLMSDLMVQPVELVKAEEAKITAGTAVPHSLDEALPGDD